MPPVHGIVLPWLPQRRRSFAFNRRKDIRCQVDAVALLSGQFFDNPGTEQLVDGFLRRVELHVEHFGGTVGCNRRVDEKLVHQLRQQRRRAGAISRRSRAGCSLTAYEHRANLGRSLAGFQLALRRGKDSLFRGTVRRGCAVPPKAIFLHFRPNFSRSYGDFGVGGTLPDRGLANRKIVSEHCQRKFVQLTGADGSEDGTRILISHYFARRRSSGR